MPAVGHVCGTCGTTTVGDFFAPLPGVCAFCRRALDVRLPVDGSVRSPALGLRGLLVSNRWNEALLGRTAGGPVIVEVCPGCESPVTAPASTMLELPCTHCGTGQRVALGDHVIDVLPTIRVEGSTWGGGMSLTWTPAHLQGEASENVPCPFCGASLPPLHGTARCPHCSSALFGLLACGRRFLPGLRVRGDDEGRPVDTWMPLPEALDHWGKRRRLVRESHKATGTIFLVWILALPVFALLAFGLVIALALFGERLGLGGMIALVTVLGLLPLAGFVSLVVWAVRRARRQRTEIVGAPPGRSG